MASRPTVVPDCGTQLRLPQPFGVASAVETLWFGSMAAPLIPMTIEGTLQSTSTRQMRSVSAGSPIQVESSHCTTIPWVSAGIAVRRPRWREADRRSYWGTQR